MKFSFSVVEFAEKQVAGIHVQTSMQNAMHDCPVLWQSFGIEVCDKLTANHLLANNSSAYGLSIMINDTDFMYWAAAEIKSTEVLPEPLEKFTIPAGLYVRCSVPNLEKLAEAYTEIYTRWPQSQAIYKLNEQGVCFELYNKHWQITDAFEIYAPVIKVA